MIIYKKKLEINIKKCIIIIFIKKVMGSFEIDPSLGKVHTYVFPIVLVLFSIFNYFDVYRHLLKYFGFTSLDFADDFD